MSNFLALLLSGLVAGSIYSLYASGLTLVYSASGIYNLAYGAFAFVNGLLFYELASSYMPRWIAFVLTVFVLAPLEGLLFEKIIFRRLAHVSEVARLMGTIGLLIGLPALAYEIIQILTNTFHLDLAQVQTTYSVPGIGPEPPKTFHLLGGYGTINSDQLIVLAATLLIVGALWVFLTRTRVGLMTRAVVDRADLAAARGINPAFTSRVAWCLGTMLASLAGVLAGPLFGLSTASALQFVVASSAVVVIARFRSLPIAVGAGLALGAFANVFAGYAGDVPQIQSVFNALPGTRSAIIYIVLLFALLWRGRERARIAGVSNANEVVPRDYLEGLPQWRRALPWVVILVALLAWTTDIVPWSHVQAGQLEQVLVIQGLGLSVVFLSFTVVVGMLGVACLAQAAFVTIGALIAGVIASSGFLGSGNFVAAIIGGVIAASALAVIVALPALRLGGLALALATLALAYMSDQILFQINGLSNYALGWQLTRPKIGPIDLQSNKSYAVFLFLVLLLAIWFVTNLQKSKTGRAILAVRFGAAGASASGISVRRATLVAFGIAGALAGLGGTLLAYGNGTASPTSWPTETGLLWLTIAVLQGVRRPVAAVMGGLLAALTARVLQIGFWGAVPTITDPTIPTILFGLSCIVVANQPDGALHTMSMQSYMLRQKWHSRQLARQNTTLDLSAESSAVPLDKDVERLVAVESERSINGLADSNGSSTATVEDDFGTADSVLAVRGLIAGYLDHEVLHAVNLVVPRGSIVALLGPNGAGKSTFCSAIAGIVPATAGTIDLDGDDVTSLSPHKRYSKGILLAPESRGIFPRLTVEENLEVSISSAEVRSKALDRFPQLQARRKIHAGSLSGGEQQMLCLAPILAQPPKLLVADELTLGLAPTIVSQINECLRELREMGVSIVMVEEKAKNILELAEFCVLLSLGRVVFSGPVAELTDQIASESYMGSAHPSFDADPLTGSYP